MNKKKKKKKRLSIFECLSDGMTMLLLPQIFKVVKLPCISAFQFRFCKYFSSHPVYSRPIFYEAYLSCFLSFFSSIVRSLRSMKRCDKMTQVLHKSVINYGSIFLSLLFLHKTFAKLQQVYNELFSLNITACCCTSSSSLYHNTFIS
jgi:CRISPR/Cas system-associated protein endoribonuclease Cas2